MTQIEQLILANQSALSLALLAALQPIRGLCTADSDVKGIDDAIKLLDQVGHSTKSLLELVDRKRHNPNVYVGMKDDVRG